jgi:hypothetical protein
MQQGAFDPVFLVYAHQRGVRSDLGMPLFWYRRAGRLRPPAGRVQIPQDRG